MEPIFPSNDDAIERADTLDETELLRQLRQGDRRAFEVVYHRYKRRMAGNLTRLLKSPDLVDETLQELFTRLWVHRENIDVNRPIKAYLFGIARHLTTDLFRRAAREEKYRVHLQVAFEESHDPVEEVFLSDDRLQLLEVAIAQMPPQRQRVFRLCKLEGKSYEEVSRLLHISTATINVHITQANAQLQAFFANQAGLSKALFALALLEGIC